MREAKKKKLIRTIYPKNFQLLNAKLDFSLATKRSLHLVKPTKDDIGKIFYLDSRERMGKIVTRDEFLCLPAENIGAWKEINKFDIF